MFDIPSTLSFISCFFFWFSKNFLKFFFNFNFFLFFNFLFFNFIYVWEGQPSKTCPSLRPWGLLPPPAAGETLIGGSSFPKQKIVWKEILTRGILCPIKTSRKTTAALMQSAIRKMETCFGVYHQRRTSTGSLVPRPKKQSKVVLLKQTLMPSVDAFSLANVQTIQVNHGSGEPGYPALRTSSSPRTKCGETPFRGLCDNKINHRPRIFQKPSMKNIHSIGFPRC